MTMVHGDIVVLSSRRFEARSTICIYRPVRTHADIFGSSQQSAQACVCVSDSISMTSFLTDGFYIVLEAECI
jgi:hypothetical protein